MPTKFDGKSFRNHRELKQQDRELAHHTQGLRSLRRNEGGVQFELCLLLFSGLLGTQGHASWDPAGGGVIGPAKPGSAAPPLRLYRDPHAIPDGEEIPPGTN